MDAFTSAFFKPRASPGVLGANLANRTQQIHARFNVNNSRIARSGLEFLHIGETLSFGKPPPNSLIYFGL